MGGTPGVSFPKTTQVWSGKNNRERVGDWSFVPLDDFIWPAKRKKR